MARQIGILMKPFLVEQVDLGNKTMTRRTGNDVFRVGDQLYIKETYFAFGGWKTDGETRTGNLKFRFLDITLETGKEYRYSDSEPEEYVSPGHKLYRESEILNFWYKRSPLFMPKKAARKWLEVTSVRRERIQDITFDDAIREGITFDVDSGCYFAGNLFMRSSAVSCFSDLWQGINGQESWAKNEEVTVIEFKKINSLGT